MALLLNTALVPRFRNLERHSRPRIICSSSAIPHPQDLAALWERSDRSRSIAGIDQALLLEPWLLADPNSRFADYNGVQVHYKIATSASSQQQNSAGKVAAILFHGFGASVFSWERLMQPLSEVLGSPVVAFDRPGFGLTSRPGSSDGTGDNPYSLEFSASIALAFLDFLKADKAILKGHSAGCIVAADAYLKAPHKIAGIVMIAPAIVAPFKQRKQKQPLEQNGHSQRPATRIESLVNIFTTLILGLQALFFQLIDTVERVTRGLREVIYTNIVVAALRSRAAIWMIRKIMDRFGRKVVRFAWYNPAKADKYVIQGYTKPLKCRNWEKALLEYVIALLSSMRVKLADQLGNITCPVLVITGDTDRLVPAWNAEKLSKLLPKSKFHLIKQCGHLPHEEAPDQVIRAIREFISSLHCKV